ncbi:MAG TPA: hypothetical protein VLB84_18580 [Bacteroidia bacterium]|jgi:hypothetical protein|nr:hypothetical protein [Bacteroidia bacterium]
MTKKRSDTLKAILFTTIILLVTRMLGSLPWWSFVVPVILFGTYISIRKWSVSGFLVGFISGFLTWLCADLYFDITYNGMMLNKMGLLLGVPKPIIFLVSGLIGGLLTGLAFYTGKSIINNDAILLADGKME